MTFSSRFLPLAVVFLSVPAAAQTKIKATKQAPSGDTKIVVHGGTGLGTFQDVQVPVNEEAGLRGDGTVLQEENANHTGFPLHAGIGVEMHPADAWTWNTVALDLLQIRAATGPSATQGSSYSRFDLSTGARYAFPVSDYNGAVGLHAGARRSTWNNVSASHFVNAVLVGGSAAFGSDGAMFELYGATSVSARFGYSEAAFFGGHEFKESTASLSEAGARLEYKLKEGVWLDTGLERETARVTIADVAEYNSFGLSVLDTQRTARAYDLATTVLRFGFRKEF